MSELTKILNKSILPGQSVSLEMDIARLHTRTKIEVPIIVSKGLKKGPCLLLNAGIHGDEVNGVEIIRQIIKKGLHKPESGTIICIPVLNVFGFLNQTRQFPDGRDLNRVFPGSKGGSLASRFAYHMMTEIVPHVDYCIDFHTGGGQRFNHPQIRIDASDAESLELAKAFGSDFIILSKNKEKSFRESMVKLDKKVLLFEGGKSLYLDRSVTKKGIQGAMKVMHYLGLRDFSDEIKSPKSHNEAVIIQNSQWIRAKYSGMYRPLVKVGKKVVKGQSLGSISDPFGEFERSIKNPREGYVLNSNESPIVNQGDALIHIGFSE